MAVQTTEEFKSAGSTSYTTAIEKLKDTDLKVRIGGALQTYVTSSPGTDQYTVTNNPTTIVLGAAASGEVHIYRETDVNSAAAVFAPGSSIRAVDLNAIHDMARFAAVEHRNQIITADIKEGQVTSTEIKDDSIVNADINASANIDNSKLADGLLKSGLTINSSNIVNGSIVDDDVSNSANISGTKLLDDSVTLAKLGSGSLPTDITVNSDNIVNGSIVDADINGSAAISHSKLNLDIVDSDVNSGANIAGSKLANDSVPLTKLGGGTLPSDITVASSNIVDGTISNVDINSSAAIEFTKLETGALPNNITVNDSNIITGTLDNRYYTETELDAGQLDNRYFTETELSSGGAIDSRYYTETELDGGQLDNRYFTEAELNGGQLNSLYFTESEITGGAADGRYYTETELDAGQLDNRYYTETELNAGQLDNRYYTETESEALFLRQDSSETIASGVTWSSTDAKVATTAAIDARIIDLLDDVGGFVPLANETSFPTANPDINNGNGTVVSVKAVSTNLTPSSGSVTIANGAGTGNTVTITGVTGVIPQGFGMILETTSTLHTYVFHRLQAKATEVNAVASNITQVVACGNNLTDIENFADLYQISTTAPTSRADGGSLTIGDLWFDSSANQVMMVYDGSAGDGFSPITPNQATITNINTVAGHVTFAEDLGSITDAINTGSGNNSINTVGAAIANVNTTATNIAKIQTVADDLNEGTSEIDTVATNIANVNNVGNNISNVNAVHSNASNINAAVSNASNINSAVSNATNINAAVSNASNITSVSGNNPNITTVANSIANVNTTAGSITNVNTVATNITDVNTFAHVYRIDSSEPTTHLTEGDLYFDTTQDELRIYNGSSWQGGVTATGNLVLKTGGQMTGNLTFSGSQTVDGRDVSADGSKLDGIESGATADQSNSEIKTAYEANSNTNAFTDALLSKLNAIEAGATGDQTVAEIVAAIAGQTIAPNVITTTNLTLDFGTL